MRTCDRRTMLAAIGATAFVQMPDLLSPAHAQGIDTAQAWLTAHARSVRTIDAADRDFSDLEPLAAAIGGSRVVQLGEPSHNAGTCFAAKVRLVTFLHQRLGFDVLVWESGIYDVSLVETALRVGEDPVLAAKRGLLQNWAASEECRPLFAYAQRSHTTGRPLTMAGFDSTLTSPFANFAAELRRYAATPRDAALRREATENAEELIRSFSAVTAYVEALNDLNARLSTTSRDTRQEAHARWERETGAALRPNRSMLERFDLAQKRLADLLRIREAQFGYPRQTGFISRVIDSLGARAANLYQRFGSDAPPADDGGLAEQNRRDALNADNLRWLIEHGYAGRKLIVWAHNAHVMNAYYEAPEWKTIRLDPAANAMKPSGVYLKEWLGRNLYTIGFSAYEGDDGWKGLFSSPIAPAPASSLEARLAQLEQPYLFVDFRSARSGSSPLRGPEFMRVPKYDEVKITDPFRPYDGLFFIRRMEQATLVPT